MNQDKYRLYRRYINGDRYLFVSIKTLPIGANDLINDFDFEKLFDFSENEGLFNCYRESISPPVRKKNCILTLEIDPKLPASTKKGIANIRMQTRQESARKAANIPEVYKEETLDTPIKLRAAIRKQPDENMWFIGIDPCYIEDIAGDGNYEYGYFKDVESLLTYLRNDVIPVIKRLHYEPSIIIGTNSPKSLSEEVEKLVKEIKDGKFDVTKGSDKESKEESKIEEVKEGSFIKRVQEGYSLSSLLDD